MIGDKIMRIYIVRHAQTEANKNGIIQGQMNTEITPEGFIKAKKMAQSFDKTNVDRIYSSPIRRAYLTASFIANVVGIDNEKIITNLKLKEIDLEPWVYKKISDLDNSDKSCSYKTYKTKPSEFVPLAGESIYDVRQRMVEAYNEIIMSSKDTETVVIVSHSMAIRTLLSFIENRNIDQVWTYHIPPASVTELQHNKQGSSIINIGMNIL